MASQVQNPEREAAINKIAAGFVELRDAESTPINSRDAATCATELEQIRRLADGACIDLLTEIETNRLYVADGHGSAKMLVRHHARFSGSEAHARKQVSAMAKALPEVMDAYRSGPMGTDHVRSIARVYANPRVRDAMVAKQSAFIREAKNDHHTFDMRLQQWKRLTDEDGPTPPNQKSHENRNARIDQDYDLALHIVASFACQQGLQIAEIFAEYVKAETLADWEKSRAEHGDNATQDHLPRSIKQRRADAMWQVFIDAAANPNSAAPPDFIHNIVWDPQTFEQLATKVLGEDAGIDISGHGGERAPAFGDLTDPSTEATLFDGIDPEAMICRTIDGVPLEPTEMMINALVNKIRRVVITAAGERVDLGKARFFTGMPPMPSSSKPRAVSSPAATFPRALVRPITSPNTRETVEPTPATGRHCVASTTGINKPGSLSSEPPIAPGTPSAPTAQKFPHSRANRPCPHAT